MPLVKRRPRKVIKLSEAAEILQISRQSIRDMIEREEIKTAPIPRRGVTSPIKVYAAQVNEIAHDWGIL